MAQRRWFYVLIGLLISTFLGGAIRVYFSPERIRLFVETQLAEKQPKFNIEFKSARLQLADSWWPSVAVELDGLSVSSKDSCVTNSAIYFEKLIIPIPVRMLLRNQNKFGHVSAGQMRFFVRPSNCVEAEIKKKTKSSGLDNFSSLEVFFQKRWNKEVLNTTRYLDELSIDTLEILRDDQTLPPALIKKINMKFLAEKTESELKFSVQLGQPWVGDSEFGEIKMSAIVRSDSVTLAGIGNLKEGQFQIASEWAIDRGDVSLNFYSQDVPSQNILRLMHHWGIATELNPTLKNQWLACDITMQGSIRNFLNLPVYLHQCRLYGDLGEMTIKTTKIESLKSGGDFTVEIQNLNVKSVLSGLGLQNHWGLISQFGQFTGDLKIFNKTRYKLTGDIRGSEIYWVNSSGQLKQKLDRFLLNLDFDGVKFSGSLRNFLIDSKPLSGGGEFSLSSAGDGDFKVSFRELQLPNVMQKLLWSGILNDVTVNAEGEMAESKIKKIKISLAARDLQTHQWILKNLKILANFYENVWLVDFAASDFQLQPESRWITFLQKLILYSNLNTRENINNDLIKNIKSKITVIDLGSAVEWQAANATLSDRQSVLSSDGRWTSKDGIDAIIKAKYPKKSATWFVYGDWAAPQIKLTGGL